MTVTRRIAAPRDRVWQVLTDLDRAPEVISAIDTIERVRGEGFDVGTRWRETRSHLGREVTEEMEVTALDPGDRYVIEAEGVRMHHRSEFVVEGDGGGTEITLTFVTEPEGTFGRLFDATIGRLFAGTTRKALEADLEDVAHTSERGA